MKNNHKTDEQKWHELFIFLTIQRAKVQNMLLKLRSHEN